MLSKLDRYIIRKYLSTFLWALGLFTVIILIFDVSEKIDDFVSKEIPAKEIILDYYLNFIPFLLNLFSPVFAFITVIFFTSKLAAKSEFVAMLAGGIKYSRIVRPYIMTAIILGIMSFVLNAWVIPQGDKDRLEFENRWIRDLKKEDYKRNIKRQIQPGIFMSLKSFNLLDSFGFDLVMENMESGRIKSKLFADKLRWNEEDQIWRITNYKIRVFDEEDNETLIRGEFMDTMIPFNPQDFFRRSDDVQSFNLNELRQYIELEKMRGTTDVAFYQTELQRRFAGPFALIVLTFIGVTVSSVKSRQGIGLHLGMGLLISFAYLFVIQFFNSYGNSGSMHPIIAVWVPNLLFLGIGMLLYRNTQK